MRLISLLLIFLVIEIQDCYSKGLSHSFDWIRVNPSEKFEDFDWSVLPEGVTKEMVLSVVSSTYVSGKDHITLLPVGGKIYALFPCRFEVLVWMGKNWENLYKGYSSGHNCQAFFFVRNNVLYSYGKYGFWKAHSELIYFNFETGYWDNLSAKNVPVNYAGVVPFIVGDKLVTIMGQYIHQSSGKDKFEKNGFYFDFGSGEWLPLEVKIPDQPDESIWMVPSFEMKDFGMHPYKYQAEIGLLVFDKKDLSLHFKKFDYTPIRDNSLSFSKGNEVWFFDQTSNLIHFNLENDLTTSFRKLGNVELLQEWPLEQSFLGQDLKVWLIGFLGIAFAFLVFGRFKSIKFSGKEEEKTIQSEIQSSDNEQIDEEVSRLIQHLLGHVNQSFDVDTFDRLLGIDTIENLDYRRVKRNRLIKELSEYYIGNFGKTLIERTRSESDKRIIYYRIIG